MSCIHTRILSNHCVFALTHVLLQGSGVFLASRLEVLELRAEGGELLLIACLHVLDRTFPAPLGSTALGDWGGREGRGEGGGEGGEGRGERKKL